MRFPKIHAPAGDDATFPMMQLSKTAATASPKFNKHTQKEFLSQTFAIPDFCNNARPPPQRINTLILMYLPTLLNGSMIAEHRLCVQVVAHHHQTETQFSFQREVKHFLFPFISCLHMWSTHWKETQTLLGKHVCVTLVADQRSPFVTQIRNNSSQMEFNNTHTVYNKALLNRPK